MRRWPVLFILALLAGCAAAPPERLVFGVSGDRPAGSSNEAADREMRAFLDRKASSICTLGYDTVQVDTLAAEEDRQIVEEELRCAPYTPSLF